MGEFVSGIGLLGRGFAYWARRPGLMLLGLVPAGIVGALLLAGLIGLGFALPGIADGVTPFADGWPGLWATVIRLAVGTAVLGAALVLAAVSFTALTLIVGEPFYDRIWRSIEVDLGGDPDVDAAYGFWRSTRDALTLLVRGVGIAILVAVIGLIPVVGGVVSVVLGVLFTGRLLADELTSRALAARGIGSARRRALTRNRSARTLGFGVATQLCFMVPLGAVVTMPAAVAGSTALARALLAADAE